MSLHFIFGRAGTGKSRRCCEEIRNYVLSGHDRKAFLLVPDQGTYTAEYLLAASFPHGGFTDVTVCGFSRLAYRIFQELHSPVADALSPLGQQIIIRRLLEMNREKLQAIRRAASYPHFSEELAAFFHQLDTFCMEEEDLRLAAEQEGDTPLGRKLSDLHLLYQAYRTYLKDHFAYEGSLFDLLAREIPKSRMIRDARIWIDGFNGLVPQKIRIVSALIRTARDVTVTLPMDSPEEAAHNGNFARPMQLYRQILQEERHADSVVLKEPVRFRSLRLKEMAEHFFSRRPLPFSRGRSPSVRPDAGLHILEAPERSSEVDEISRTIAALVRDRGFRYRDILILLRNPDDYTDLFERSFALYQIPGFIDQKHPMNNHPLVVLLDRLLRFLTAETHRKGSGWRKELLFRLLKTHMLSELSPDEVDRLENYVLLHRIRPSQWHTVWEFREIRSLDEAAPPPDDREREQLAQVNQWREKVVCLLDDVTGRWRAAGTAEEKCAVLYDFLLAESIPQKIFALDEKDEEKTNLRPHLQVWKKVLSLLDEIVHASGKDSPSDEDFLAMFEDGLSALTYSTIPPSLDHVTVTGLDRGYSMEARAVFIPGAAEGDFPKRLEERGFFTEAEKERLYEQSSFLFSSNLMQQIHEEEFAVYLAFTRARDVLYISRPKMTEDGKETELSFPVSRLIALSYPSEVREVSVPSPERNDPSFFCHPGEALSFLPGVLREKIPGKDSFWTGLVSWAANSRDFRPLLLSRLRSLSYANRSSSLPPALAARLFKPGGRFSSSVTRLESYRSCPYKYFLQYGLSVEERKEGGIETPDFGLYLHAGLHQFGAALEKDRRQWRDATDEDIEHLSAEIARNLSARMKYGILHSDGASRYTERELNKTFRNALVTFREWSRRSSFDTKALEKDFLVRLAAEEGDSLTLRGKIDRLDISGNRAVIADYKTGGAEVSLREIVAGLKLQLLTYFLAAAEEAGRTGNTLLPAALMYIYLSGDVRAVAQTPSGGIPKLPEKDKAAGYFLNDPQVLRELDAHMGETDSFLAVRLKKDGTFYASPSVLTEEEFRSLLTIVRRNILSLYRKMCSGDISIRPVRFEGKTACTYCPYRSVCRFDPSLPGEEYDYAPLPGNAFLKKNLAAIAAGADIAELAAAEREEKEDSHE